MGLAFSSLCAPQAAERESLRLQFGASCTSAAEAIARADVLLLCTGAGFSADSGLAVYKDIANVQAYRSRGLEYSDICKPHWLHKEPELFYGFWGSCFNDYREAQGHEGYDIMRRWRDWRFRDTCISRKIQAQLKQNRSSRSTLFGDAAAVSHEGAHETEPHHVQGAAGAFFVFTSNVDAHSFDFFEAHEVRECHGNTEVWQCGSEGGPCCKRTWRAPASFTFVVDKQTMRAPPRVAEEGAAENGGDAFDRAPVEDDPCAGDAAAAAAADHEETRTAPCAAVLPRDDGRPTAEGADAVSGAVEVVDAITSSSAGAECAAAAASAFRHAALGQCREVEQATVNADKHDHQCATDGCTVGDGVKGSDMLGVVGSPVDYTTNGTSNAARVGQTHQPFGHRKDPLTKLPPPAEHATVDFAAGGNWPRCPHCGGPGRPAILMFADMAWVENEAQESRWEAWVGTVSATAKAMESTGRRLRTAILEIGCGENVRTVRMMTEDTARHLAKYGAHVTVVRVNLDFPFPDSQPESPRHHHISLLGGGLEAIRLIDAELQNIRETHVADGESGLWGVTERAASWSEQPRVAEGESGTKTVGPEPVVSSDRTLEQHGDEPSDGATNRHRFCDELREIMKSSPFVEKVSLGDDPGRGPRGAMWVAAQIERVEAAEALRSAKVESSSVGSPVGAQPLQLIGDCTKLQDESNGGVSMESQGDAWRGCGDAEPSAVPVERCSPSPKRRRCEDDAPRWGIGISATSVQSDE